MIQSGFMKLYSFEMSVVYLKSPITEFPCCVLSEEDRCYLERVVDDEEIRKPCGLSKPSRHLGLMDYMLVFFSTFGMMSKILFVMKLRKHLALVSFRSI